MKLGLLFQRTDENKDKIETNSTTTTKFKNEDGSPIDGSPKIESSLKREDEKKYDQEFLGNLGFNWRLSDSHKLTLGIEGSLKDREKNKRVFEQKLAPKLEE